MAALQNAFLELLERKSLDEITIREITDAAGVNYTTFFRRCAGKPELLNNIAAMEVRNLLSLGEEAMMVGGPEATSLSMFAYVQARRKLWKTLLTGGARSAIREEFMRISGSFAATHLHEDPPIPIDLAVALATSSIIEILTWWLRQPDDYPAEEVSRLYDTIVVDAIRHARSV